MRRRPPAGAIGCCLGHLLFSLLIEFLASLICYHPRIPAASNCLFNRHCERGEAIQCRAGKVDCFVAALLAMTVECASCRANIPAPYSFQCRKTRDEMPRILMTGASGGIGTSLRKLLPPIYPDLLLSDLKAPADLGANAKLKTADLAGLAQAGAIREGVDGILHFGGFSVEGPWDNILQSNIVGCYNLFEAARKKGVKRIVFASAKHAVGFYPRHHRIGTDVTARPDSRYGVSKVFGEAVGALYADKHGLGVTCLRIGNFGDKPLDHRRLSIWLKPEDLVQLCRIGLDHPDIHFEIFYGVSYNERTWFDNHRAYDLGYRPTGRAEDFPEHPPARG